LAGLFLAETANPQGMGAALTFARRYALFTLVGIANEDDLDAPNLCGGPHSPTPSADQRSLKPGYRYPRVPPRKPGNGQRRHSLYGERPSILEPEQGASILTALRRDESMGLQQRHSGGCGKLNRSVTRQEEDIHVKNKWL
jgi:hypothetical protein